MSLHFSSELDVWTMMTMTHQRWCWQVGRYVFGAAWIVLATSLKDNGGQDVVCSVTHVLLHPYCLLFFRSETEGRNKGDVGRRGGGGWLLWVCVCACVWVCLWGKAQTACGNLMCVPGDVWWINAKQLPLPKHHLIFGAHAPHIKGCSSAELS